MHPTSLAYASPTGTVLIRWEGARRPTVWTVRRPRVDPFDARLELARRYLHIYGPASAGAFGQWSGIGARDAEVVFAALRKSLTKVQTPIGEAWILTQDEPAFSQTSGLVAPAPLLPSGDSYILLYGADRELLVPDTNRRGELWTQRVWPGGLVVDGEIAGTWRRANAAMAVDPWRRLSRAESEAVEAEASSLPEPGIEGKISVSWDD